MRLFKVEKERFQDECVRFSIDSFKIQDCGVKIFGKHSPFYENGENSSVKNRVVNSGGLRYNYYGPAYTASVGVGRLTEVYGNLIKVPENTMERMLASATTRKSDSELVSDFLIQNIVWGWPDKKLHAPQLIATLTCLSSQQGDSKFDVWLGNVARRLVSGTGCLPSPPHTEDRQAPMTILRTPHLSQHGSRQRPQDKGQLKIYRLVVARSRLSGPIFACSAFFFLSVYRTRLLRDDSRTFSVSHQTAQG
ncbi:hypothetical protein RRG08_038110 [Elysia crispata]|uniref:Uncharacterized protein n=1 Tax=Elysia crispata TaxID=231223 RepID=A0AAE0ZY63_9GAST|nr:hypothetical protein RRG08_038110 [Elysia crispata]